MQARNSKGPMEAFPPLREVTTAQFQGLGPLPSLVIRTDDDVERWKISCSYFDYDLFLRRLGESVVGTVLPWNPETASQVSSALRGAVHFDLGALSL